MPTYTFECDDHGAFDVLRSFSEADQPLACPICKGPTQRVFTAPALRSMAHEKRIAIERNERSRHEPQFRKKRVHACGHDHSDGSSCGGGGGQTGLKSYAGPRPWVIEHPT